MKKGKKTCQAQWIPSPNHNLGEVKNADTKETDLSALSTPACAVVLYLYHVTHSAHTLHNEKGAV